MKSLLHGTTREGFEGIIKEGFHSKSPTWEASWDGDAYFYEPLKYYSRFKCDIDENTDIEEVYEVAFKHGAIGNANIAKALRNENGNDVYVIELIVDDKILESDYFLEDWSCFGNMSHALCICEDFLNDYLEDGLFNIKIHKVIGAYDEESRLAYLNLESLNNLSEELLTEDLKNEIMKNKETEDEELYESLMDNMIYTREVVYDSRFPEKYQELIKSNNFLRSLHD